MLLFDVCLVGLGEIVVDVVECVLVVLWDCLSIYVGIIVVVIIELLV